MIPVLHNMEDRYEALRHQVIKGHGTSAGLTLFLCRGMAAWMNAWKEYSPSGDNVRQKLKPPEELPIGIQDDLVMTLVNMALNIRRGTVQ